jgi:Ca2+-transporting ATPase
MSETPASKYCNLDIVTCLTELEANTDHGLSNQSVLIRKGKYGLNELDVEEKESLVSKIIEQFKNPLILLLLSSACISMFLGQYDNAFSITMVQLESNGNLGDYNRCDCCFYTRVQIGKVFRSIE